MEIEYLKSPLNKYTFKIKSIREWIENNSNGKVLNLFAGKIKATPEGIHSIIERLSL